MRASLWGLVMVLLSAIAIAAEEKTMQPSTIQEVKKKHETRLLALPGVVSVGIGRDNEGNAAIIIGLERARTQAEAQLPNTLDGHKVIVQISGTLKPMD